MSTSIIEKTITLGFPWETFDPFLFCVHHLDHYPAGDENMAPQASLRGRAMGQDFSGKDGWSMYHGQVVPGFPRHPHRGFETITIARQGFIDHSDSLGATARFGRGDVQWMTAGSGVVHSEMFPLVHREDPNPTELFQIWLNLPRSGKKSDPYFRMLWDEEIPELSILDTQDRATQLRVIAGAYQDTDAPAPPPDSWASSANSDLQIWTLRMEPQAELTLPAGPAGVNRALYFFDGQQITLGQEVLSPGKAAKLKPQAEVPLQNGDQSAELLFLQGRPIGEPVVQHGPFVVNSQQEIYETIREFQRTGFGGWPWDTDGPVHDRDRGRFAVHVDGRLEEP